MPADFGHFKVAWITNRNQTNTMNDQGPGLMLPTALMLVQTTGHTMLLVEACETANLDYMMGSIYQSMPICQANSNIFTWQAVKANSDQFST
jgi:hypothetical protein